MNYEVGKSARIAAELRGAILAGDLEPGERATSVLELQEANDCSYTTAVKVLWMLAQEGIITTKRGAETRVSQPDEVIAFTEARIAELEEVRAWATRLKGAGGRGRGSR